MFPADFPSYAWEMIKKGREHPLGKERILSKFYLFYEGDVNKEALIYNDLS